MEPETEMRSYQWRDISTGTLNLDEVLKMMKEIGVKKGREGNQMDSQELSISMCSMCMIPSYVTVQKMSPWPGN